jgi:16S rRNA (cytidine1402-2'-O)-methyltransferase
MSFDRSTPSSSGGSPEPAAPDSQLAVLYLIPAYLDESALSSLPAYLLGAIQECKVFFVENERSARRYLKALWKEMVIDDYEWVTIHKAEEQVISHLKKRLSESKTIGVISEAGCPGVADPGQLLVAAAHQAGARVRPLVGPSAILLAIMASGMNGQQFRFVGYLPVDSAARAKALKELEADSQRLRSTQVFIETPYRNQALIETIMQNCRPSTRLCIAVNLTASGEHIRTLTVGEWKKVIRPDLHKQPAIFCLLA